MKASDRLFIQAAVLLAEHGRLTCAPNPTEGCIIVRNGQAIGRGYHEYAGQGHAEVNAIADAGGDVTGSTVYVSLEPCSFIGRTPACAQTLIDAGVTRVVIGALDPNPRVAGNGIAMLKAANADIGAARAAFYPSVNIGPSLLLAANPSASDLTLAGSVIAPIFQGGRLDGNLDRVTARQKELAENYQQTVLVAFQEAENALTKVQKTLERENALRQAATKAREAYDIAKNQYSLSVIEFQDVLDSQRMMLESEDQYEHARYETLAARIELFKAMGGGWKKE